MKNIFETLFLFQTYSVRRVEMGEKRNVYVTVAFAGVALMVAMVIGVVVMRRRSARYPQHQVRHHHRLRPRDHLRLLYILCYQHKHNLLRREYILSNSTSAHLPSKNICNTRHRLSNHTYFYFKIFFLDIFLFLC